MRIEPISNPDGTQYITSDKPFFVVGWLEGSSEVWKHTPIDEYIDHGYDGEGNVVRQNKVSNAQFADHPTDTVRVLGFGWEIDDLNDIETYFASFINEIENEEGLIIVEPEE